MPYLTVLRPGMLTTVQDLGRWGWQSSGVPVAGPMDAYSHRFANRIAGNDENAAALEITLIGPELEAHGDITCVIAGAAFGATAGEVMVRTNTPFLLQAGMRLRFGARTAGARAVLAVRGGIGVAEVFGSKATSLISRMGPLEGRPLAAGDVLPVGSEAIWPAGVLPGVPLACPAGGARLRVIRGPHDGMFTAEAFETLFTSRFTVTSSSNRMGYRLEGPALSHSGPTDILSDATPLGSLQVPASGQPILLMADRQTTGGYPKIATVITADLPLAGQLAPGDWIAFAPSTRPAAIAALKQQQRRLEGRR